MKVYWWQGGLHFEPEGDEERKALLVVTQNLRYVDDTDEECTGDDDDSKNVGGLNNPSTLHVTDPVD